MSYRIMGRHDVHLLGGLVHVRRSGASSSPVCRTVTLSNQIVFLGPAIVPGLIWQTIAIRLVATSPNQHSERYPVRRQSQVRPSLTQSRGKTTTSNMAYNYIKYKKHLESSSCPLHEHSDDFRRQVSALRSLREA